MMRKSKFYVLGISIFVIALMFMPMVALAMPVPVTGITLSHTTLALERGHSQWISVTFNPSDATNKTITWSSSNSSVASVSISGMVTPRNSGTATITATSADGPTATCEVTVTTPVQSINVLPDTLNIYTGETGTLSAHVTPTYADNTDVSWVSSDETVATVDSSGVVTGVSAGTANISATSQADGSISDTSAVIVTDKINVTGITLSDSALNLAVGESSNVNATITPSDASINTFTWSSSDESVARYGWLSGIEAVGIGTATITATTTDGGLTATCIVTVTPPAVHVTGVDISPETASVSIGETTNLRATVSPSDASNTAISWASSDTSVATVNSSGVVTGVAEGLVAITATTVDGGLTDTCIVTVDDTSAATGTITGQILDADGNPYVGSVVLNSTPVTVVLDSEGRFTFKDATLTVHRLDVLDSSGTLVGEYFLDFEEGTNESHSTSEKKTDITYTSNTALINFNIKLNSDNTVTLESVTFVSNPQTGDRSGALWLYIVAGAAFVCMVGFGLTRIKRLDYKE